MKQERAGVIWLLCFIILLAGYGCDKRSAEERAAAGGAGTVAPVSSISPAPTAAGVKSPVEQVFADLSRIAVSPEGPVWAVAHDPEGEALWMSADKGQAWMRMLFRNMIVGAIAPVGQNKGWIVGQTGCDNINGASLCRKMGIYSTNDGGYHWEAQWEMEPEQAEPAGGGSLWFADEESGFAIAGGRLLRTQTGGERWIEIELPDLGKGKSMIPEKMAFADAQIGWVAGRSPEECSGSIGGQAACGAPVLAYTEDGGHSWRLQELPGAVVGQEILGLAAVSPSVGRTLLYSRDSMQAYLYGTENAGEYWEQRQELRGGHPYIQGLAFVSADKGFFPLGAGAGGIEGGLLKTEDGGRSQRPVQLEGATSVEQVLFGQEGSGWLLYRDMDSRPGLMRSDNGGDSWEPVSLKSPTEDKTAYLAAAVWKQAATADGVELLAKDAKDSDFYASGFKVVSADRQRIFPWNGELGSKGSNYPPQLLHVDLDGDGKNEIVVILTVMHGAGMLEQEFHVLRPDLTEVQAEQPLAAIRREVKAGLSAKEDGTVEASIQLQKQSFTHVFAHEDAGVWFDGVAFGARTEFALADGKLVFRVSAAASPGMFLGTITGVYSYKDGMLVPDQLGYEKDIQD